MATRKRTLIHRRSKIDDYNLIELRDMMNPSVDFMRLLAQQTVQAAREGNAEAAIDILRDYVGAIDQYSERTWHGPIHWEYAVYIAEAFEKIVRAAMRADRTGMTKWSDFETGNAQANANLALGIKISKAGRRKGATTHDALALAAAFNLLLLRGFQATEAKSWLKEKTGASPRTIEIANREHQTYHMYRVAAIDPSSSAKDREFAEKVINDGAEPYAQKIEEILNAKTSRRR